MFLTRLGDITTDDLLMYFIFGMIIFGVMVLILCLVAKGKEYENSTLPVNESAAKIIGKQPYTNAFESTPTHEWVVFELHTGERVRLLCELRNNHVVGDEGTLRWQGNHFLSFTMKR